MMLKYPRTSHLVGSKLQFGDSTEGQIPVTKLAGGVQVWEEKIDGANSGVSFISGQLKLQSRGHYLEGGPGERQFDLFKAWAQVHATDLFDILGHRYVMYGEWCFAKHTVFYDRLPHYFLEFDIFDRDDGYFLSMAARHNMLAGGPVVSVPVIHTGAMRNEKQMRALVQPSLYKSADWKQKLAALDPTGDPKETDQSDMSEGLYLKHEDGDRVVGRYKFVRGDFLQVISDSGSHWAARQIVQNQLASDIDIFR